MFSMLCVTARDFVTVRGAVTGFRNMNEQAQACLRKAEECEHSAQRTTDESARLLYLDLANHWRTLAERVEAMDRQRARLERTED
jgi:hypothetical protein